jgi:hypothetical protein
MDSNHPGVRVAHVVVSAPLPVFLALSAPFMPLSNRALVSLDLASML